ncbi:MAG: dATP/dGTP diphosphohydrolase domain-containing protein [Polyangiaceae bacterium]
MDKGKQKKTQVQVADEGRENKVEATGAAREQKTGKGRYDLVSPEAERRVALHYEAGALRYGDRNWEKGLPLSGFIDCAKRHLQKHAAGDRTEDHLAAVLWNVGAYMQTERWILEGKLPNELYDVPWAPSSPDGGGGPPWPEWILERF